MSLQWCLTTLSFAGVLLLGYADVPSYTEKHGYTDVRSGAGAYMFWWLYKADNGSANRPLFLWLQGGPGASGTGYGNFREIGPVDQDQNPRETTWLTKGDLVFVDSPVGTGYSYAERRALYTRNIDEIAADLLAWAKDFIRRNPEYSTRPFYIIGESYGGKMAAQFAKYLYDAIQAGHITMNFRGVVFGGSWISPIDYLTTWGPYLYYNFGKLDEAGFEAVQKKARECVRYVDTGRWHVAVSCWGSFVYDVRKNSNNTNFYNVHKPRTQHAIAGFNPMERLYQMLVAQINEQNGGHGSLNELMNGPIKQKLGIPHNVRWGGRANSFTVFAKQYVDLMYPVVNTVEYLLANTSLNITVYTGELDLMCNALGAKKWINRLQWQYSDDFQHAPTVPYRTTQDPSQVAFYRQRSHNLAFYYINNAGHMAPQDAPYATLRMLDMITGAADA